MMKSPFKLSANCNTDAWKKPPSHNVFNAPFAPHSKNSVVNFLSACTTFSAAYSLQFDQAGIMLVFQKTGGSEHTRKWIKSGVELFNGAPHLSTVCCDNWADWSIAPMPQSDRVQAGQKSVSILIEKKESPTGSCLWVYFVDGETQTPMREICWPFGEASMDDWELEVGAFVARPDKQGSDKLEAEFEAFDVKWKEN